MPIKKSIIQNGGNVTNKMFSSNYVTLSTIPKSGFGVFAGRYYKKGEVVEMCPFYEMPNFKHMESYTYTSHLDNKKSIIVFGNGSLFNHSINNNLKYVYNKDMDRIIKYVATKNIKPTDELFINYGTTYKW